MFVYRLDDHAYLKMLDLKDAPFLYELMNNNRAHLRQWLPFVDGTQSVDDTRSFIEHTMKQFAANNGFQAGIWYRDQIAGVIGFHMFDWANKKTSIGYWLGSEFQGLGLMTKSTKAFVDYAIYDVQLNRVEIRCATDNLKSRAIPERLGFSLEGISRQSEWLYDRYVDHVIYGMLASDW